MLTVRPYLTTTSGAVSEKYLKTAQTVYGDVTVVSVDIHHRGPESLHPDRAVTLRLSGDFEDARGYTAIFMYSDYWSRPQFGTDFSTVPDRTQGLIVEKTDGTYAVFLPICSDDYKCDLRGGEEGLTAVLFSWYDKLQNCVAPAFCYACGDDPFALMEQCAKVGLEILGRGGKVRAERRYPEIFEYLGWCSWDAMQIRVNENGLLEKCKEFADKGIPVRWSILDDMWAEVRPFWDAEYETFGDMCQLMHSSPLYSFEADPRRFPDGLKHCIDKMHDFGMTVGMWHPATGYWRGIDPDSPLFTEIRDLLIQRPDGRWIPSPAPGCMYQFYLKFHDFLKHCGADFVKIDFQSCMRAHYRGLEPIGNTAKTLSNAIEASVGLHFDNALINCMGMASENMWNRQSTNISRCSDDFKPEDRAWFKKHILQCAYNSFVQGQFHTCDWDMWWTDDGQAVKNSVLRAISGGPIYVSDQLGRSNADILRPLALDDGRILRCDRPAMPAKADLARDPEYSGAAFLVQNTCAGGRCGVIAAFDLSAEDAAVDGEFSPMDVWGLASADEYAVYEYFTGEWKIIGASDVYRFTLANQDDFRLYLLVPYENRTAVLGIIDKMIAPLTVTRLTDDPVDCETACGGRFAYIRDGALIITEKV